ncbi:DUF2617 family protein [Jiangella rhizosphaerae]|uniref:DUF2617 family protein n=1 Tax=Jiangella rhizosphaerae TaxID=2293569 RepID=A0A418KM77_9ACTN|nr:DUF2617 family protein [Jiangella rhizosphaerae]RIQ19493.1 DUF2617 family protein [Jiangella rhizosphaerae]
MLATLDVPYVDTRASDLVWTLDHPLVSPLALTMAGPLELRVLGASHQVVFGDLVETVACLPGRPARLPGDVRREAGGWTYRFRATVEELPATTLRARVGELRRLAAEPAAVVAAFPSDPDAVTALRAGRLDAGAVGWSTWHAYPGAGQLVTTRTELTR